MTPLSEGTTNRRQGLMNFTFSRGPVALAAEAANCTTAITPTVNGDPNPLAIETGRGEDEVVPPPVTAPVQEEVGDSVNTTEQTVTTAQPIEAGQANEENLQPIAEGGEEGERGEEDEGAIDLGGEEG